ncbi:MAG: hypothetical protein PHI31_08045 [Desulfuromonadaceae bacterium]|nr:hypothetical protein [Desulfuromonadaceae bacterium]
MGPPETIQEIACQQVMVDDASIYSIQWTDLPDPIADSLSAATLLSRYLGYIHSCTQALIRPTTLESGIEFRLLWTRLSLISFLPPEFIDSSATLHICGGFLVQPRKSDHGKLRFGIEHLNGYVRATLQLTDYYPMILGGHSPSPIRFWLYRYTQAALHRLVTVRFMSLLYGELAGFPAAVRIVNVFVRAGKAL